MAEDNNQDRDYITLVKPDGIWIKQPTRALREDSTFSYVDLFVSDDDRIGLKPVEGGEVTGTSYRLHDGSIDCEGIGGEIDVELLNHAPIPFETTYDSAEDIFTVHLNKPVFDMRKSKVIEYIRKTVDLDGNTVDRLSKEEMIELFSCSDEFELLEAINQEFSDDVYSAHVTFNLNKQAYAELAEKIHKQHS